MKNRAILGSRRARGFLARDSTRRVCAAAGTASADRTYETASAIAIVSASGRKKAPATPERRAKGKKITIVDRLDPVSAGRTSAIPDCAGSQDTRSRRWAA